MRNHINSPFIPDSEAKEIPDLSEELQDQYVIPVINKENEDIIKQLENVIPKISYVVVDEDVDISNITTTDILVQVGSVDDVTTDTIELKKPKRRVS